MGNKNHEISEVMDLMNLRKKVASDAKDAQAMKELDDKTGLHFKKKFLAEDVKEKLELLSKSTDWEEKSSLLQWSVDCLRSELIDGLEVNGHM